MQYKEIKKHIIEEAREQLIYLRKVLDDQERSLKSEDIDEFNTGIILLKCMTQFLNEDRGFLEWANNMVNKINKKYSGLMDKYNSEH